MEVKAAAFGGVFTVGPATDEADTKVKDKIIEAMMNLIFFMINIPNVVNNVEKFPHC